MNKNITTPQIAKVIKETLEKDFDVVKIIEVRVVEDVDSDGDDILRVEVVFDGTRKKNLDARLVSSAVRHVRPKLFDLGALAFPLFSFVSNKDPGLTKFERA